MQNAERKTDVEIIIIFPLKLQALEKNLSHLISPGNENKRIKIKHQHGGKSLQMLKKLRLSESPDPKLIGTFWF